MSSTFIPATISQIEEELAKFKANEEFNRRHQIIHFIKKWWGEKAYKIVGVFENEYNDEDYDLRINRFDVYDKEGNPLEHVDFVDDSDEFDEWVFDEEFWDVRDEFTIRNVGSSSNQKDLVFYTEIVPVKTIYFQN